MSSHQYFRIVEPKIIHETIDNEVVIVNLDSGNYYSLDNIGAEIWDSIKLETSLEDIIESISFKYIGDKGDIVNGIDHFISQLLEEELIAPEEPHETRAITDTIQNVESEEEIQKIPYTAPALNTYTDMQDLLLLDPIHEVDEQGWPHAKDNSDKTSAQPPK